MSKHNKPGTKPVEETPKQAQPQEQSQEQAHPQKLPAEPAIPPEMPDYHEQYVRLYAEFDNFRKRTAREKASLIAYGKKEIALKLLPMYEVLLRQQKNLQGSTQDPKALQDGMRMILRELSKALETEGIHKMEVLNKPYNPDMQEVVATVPAPAEKDGLVIDEVKMGFMMQDQVLRPASVVVGQAPEEK